MIDATKERGPKTLYEFSNRIIIYLYRIINFSNKSFCVGLLIIIKCFEHQFIPKHSAWRSFACSRSDIEVEKRPGLDIDLYA